MDEVDRLFSLLKKPFVKKVEPLLAEDKENATFTAKQNSAKIQDPIALNHIRHSDGRLTSHPPIEHWDDWVEWDAKAWPTKIKRQYNLVPTICFNCESACGLLAYIDKETGDVKKFEGNPVHPGSRGRTCAKGPATLNQIYDPERILYPLKRVGKRGSGEFVRVSWDQVLDEIGAKMAASRKKRRDGIMYHVGRPGEDHYANRCIKAWGVDGHNSHTNICSAGARAGYSFWGGFDRPSPDYTNAKVILLISSHLETGHYFNPHAQRIIEAQTKGAKIITMDPRLSNTASKSDLWIPTWPGSECYVLLAVASYLIEHKLYDQNFVRNWVNWKEFIDFFISEACSWPLSEKQKRFQESLRSKPIEDIDFEEFHELLSLLYAEFSFERASEEAQVEVQKIRLLAEYIGACDGKLAAHTWRSASIGNLGGWQVARCLYFLNVLTGSVGKRGGTLANSDNKFTPKPFLSPPDLENWNELQMPQEWPFAFYEMSFLLPHFLEEEKGDIDVYFTRCYNPLWINPDGFMWLKALQNEEKVKLHVALTPTWNETAWFADYVLPMGHGSERHDLMSQETHAGVWIGFRQPVHRVAMEKAQKKVKFTYEANPGEVWEEAEFWVELSGRMDPDGNLGIRKWFESPYRPNELISQDEYWQWIFENSVPGLKETAEKQQLSALEYMKKFGCFEIKKENYEAYAQEVKENGVFVDGKQRKGFATPSKKLEIFSKTLFSWGWKEKEYTLPWVLESHVHPKNINRSKGEMILLPNFRLPTLIHTRSANCKWLYEISHKNPVWMNPVDAQRIGVDTGELIRVETEIGYFVDRVWITEGMKPGVVAMSHHLGRWRLKENEGVNEFSSSFVKISEENSDEFSLRILDSQTETRNRFAKDADLQRVWWKEVGVHQNLTHAVHPDPISGAHCWLQKAFSVQKARTTDKLGDVWVDTKKSMQTYRQWSELCRDARTHSPDATRRPYWLKRPLKPSKATFKLP